MLPVVLAAVDPTVPQVAERIVEIQRVAYALEAELIGFDGIPQLSEGPEQVRALGDMEWTGAFDGEALVGLIAWARDGDTIDIDRLAVDPAWARRGVGRQLVRSVPRAVRVLVQTGAANGPAVALYLEEGFTKVRSTEVASNVEITQFERLA